MSRVRTFSGIVVLALGVLLIAGDVCQAQPRGRRGGFGGFGRMDATTLLRSEQVQNELKLSETQKAQVEQALRESREARRELFSGGGLRDLSEEERAELREKMQKLSETTEKKIGGILSETQQKRLDEITLQVAGIGALRRDEVQSKLDLTDEQKKKVRELFAAQAEMQRELFRGLRDLSREERRQKFQELQQKREEIEKETEKAVLEALTSTQQQKWNQMKGEPFELDRRALFRGFGRRGRRDNSNN